MNKICTDIEQSQKLIELGIDINTADMYHALDANVIIPEPYITKSEDETLIPAYKGAIPAWSPTALMVVLDRAALFKTPKGWACQTYIEYKAITGNYHNNPVDACFEVVCLLKKEKYI